MKSKQMVCVILALFWFVCALWGYSTLALLVTGLLLVCLYATGLWADASGSAEDEDAHMRRRRREEAEAQEAIYYEAEYRVIPPSSCTKRGRP